MRSLLKSNLGMPLIRSDVPKQALLKRFALIYLPIVIVLSIVLLSKVRLEEQLDVERIEGRENNHIEIAKAHLTQDIEMVDSDLRVIALLPLLQRYLDSGSPAHRDELAKLFLVLAKEKRYYDKVRYLDASGQEVIRINYNDGKPAIVPHEQLQDKSARYFFRDTFRLNKGEVYVSPLDLNVEENRLEIPYKPTIRFGTPVFDSAGRKKGILLFNYFGNDLLLDFHKVMRGGDHSSMLLNSDGYWLGSANHADEWGFMLGKSDRTFGHDFADEWRTISTGEGGTLLTAKGLFIYSTVHPLLLGQHSSTGSALINASSQQELASHEYYWKIVSFFPHIVLSGAAFYNQTGNMILLATGYLLFALGAFIVALVTLSRKQVGDKLVESEQHFRAVTETANDAIVTGTGVGNIVGWNTAAERLFGYTKAEIIGQPLTVLMPERFRNLHSEGLARVVDGGTPHLIGKTVEVIGLRKDGSEFPLELSLAQWQTADSQFFNAIIRDITERKQVESELRIAATVFESQEGMLITDARNVIQRVNRAFTEITGYTAEEAVGQTPRLLTSGRQDAAFYATMWESIRHTGAWQGEIWNRRKCGEVYPERLTITAVKGGNGETTHYVATLHDITERKAVEEKISNLAFFDTLTQLPNRRMLNDRLGQAMATCRRSGHYGALMFLDMDNFKPLNDTYGHGVGDLLLIEVAHRLTSCVRKVDTVARFGGDEFVVMLSELDADKAKSTAQAGIVAEKIRSTLAETYLLKVQHGGKVETTVEHHCTASIGVVLFINHGASTEDILKWADTAMYQAKEAGRNLIRFYEPKA